MKRAFVTQLAALAVPGIALIALVSPASAQGLTLPSMTLVGAPNMFDQNGHMNTQQNTNLPNAFNWHPYMPGVPAQVGNSRPTPIQIVPPYGGQQSYPVIEYNDNNYYGGYGGGWSGGGYTDGGGYYNGGYYNNSRGNYQNGYNNGYAQQNAVVTQPAQPVSTPSRPFQPGPPATATTITPVNTQPQQQGHRHRDQGSPYYSTVTIVDGGTPTLIGGYYYPNYCDNPNGPNIYPSIYSIYGGFPGYIYSPDPGVTVVSDPYYPAYAGGYSSFSTPTYQVTYNQNNYYAASPQTAEAIEDGGTRAEGAVKSAYAEDTYQAAFADIEQAWMSGNVGLIRKHLRDADTKISVLINRKYSYSISSDDFSQITRDAMQKLDTVSFKFTRLRKAKNGDVTAYGIHTYNPSATADDKDDDTVAFDTKADTSTDNSHESYTNENQPTNSAEAADGTHKTMFVSYTLRKAEDGWIIVLVDSSAKKLVPSQTDDAASPSN